MTSLHIILSFKEQYDLIYTNKFKNLTPFGWMVIFLEKIIIKTDTEMK